MKWKSLLLWSSLFNVAKTASDPIQPINTTAIVKKLARFNVSFDPYVTASTGFIFDTQFNPADRDQEVHDTTQLLLSALKNPEVFCTLVYIVKKSMCDKSGTLAPLKIEVASRELMREDGEYAGGYIYVHGFENTIAIAVTYKIEGNEAYVIRHEMRHAFWNAFNLAECTPHDSQRKAERFADYNLSFMEQRSAPYDSKNKASIAEALAKGEEQILNLKKISAQLSTSPTYQLSHPRYKKMIDCYEKEASKVPLTNFFARSNPAAQLSPLMQIITKFEQQMNLNKATYVSGTNRIYEIEATVFGALMDNPALYNDHFKKIRSIEKNLDEHTQCIKKLAPSRLSLSCK